MTLGEKIIELRKKENLTQEKLATKIGISRQTLSNWESDITSPDIQEAKTIAQLFHISLDDLTNCHLDIKCRSGHSILQKLIGEKYYVELLEEDYRISDDTICTVLEIEGGFIKLEFQYNKKNIIKLLDLNLVSTIRRERDK